MILDNLRVFQFRNLVDASVSFSPTGNFLVGKNGQGKTNLMEAIYFLSSGRSFRTARAAEQVRWKCNEGSVFGELRDDDSDTFELGISIQAGRRTAYVNGDKNQGFSDYLGKFQSISFAPTDLELVRGGPRERRSFLDKHLSQLSKTYFEDLITYQKALKNKNALLRSYNVDREEVRTWNEMLSKPAFQITKKRASFLEDIDRQAEPIHETFSLPDGSLSIFYQPACTAESEESLKQQMDQALDKELIVKKSTTGPHLDDFTLLLDSNPARAFASQGQARSLVLTLKMAVMQIIEQVTGKSPVVLLDDVESELDIDRRTNLFHFLQDCGRQVFVTGTGLPRLNTDLPSGAKIFEIQDGVILEKNY